MDKQFLVVCFLGVLVGGVMGGYGGSFGWESRHACNASSTPLTRGDNYFPSNASDTHVAMVTGIDSQTNLPVVFFLGNDGGVWSVWRLGNHSGGWSDLVSLGKPGAGFIAIDVTDDSSGILNVFGLTPNGQIYRAVQAKPTKSSTVIGCMKPPPAGRLMPCTQFSNWAPMNTHFSPGTTSFQSRRSGSGVISLFGVTSERAYEIREYAANSGLFGAPVQIASKHSIKSSFVVARNDVTGVFEGFARLSNNDNLQRTWQDDSSTWSGSWSEPGTFPPNFQSDPVVLVKPDGLLEIYTRNGDSIHTLNEKSCKKNGNCDYGSWDGLPNHDKTKSAQNWGLTNTIGGGTELVLKGDDGNLYRTYQTSQGGKWSSWESIGKPSGPATLLSQPVAVQNENGVADILIGQTDGYLAFYSGPNTIKTTPDNVADGQALTISWNVGNDVAQKDDQICIYSIGEQDPKKFLLSVYTNGKTSPGKNPVPSGMYSFAPLRLPVGTYEARYVSSNGHAIISQPFQQSSNGGSVSPLNIFFRGLTLSLGISGFDPDSCLSSNDATKAFQYFGLGFTNYSSGAVVDGIHNIGEGLLLFSNSLLSCGKPQVGNAVHGFSQDMADCTDSSCNAFNTASQGKTVYNTNHNIDLDLSTASSQWLNGKYEQSGTSLGMAVEICSYY